MIEQTAEVYLENRVRRKYIPVPFGAVSIEDEFWKPRLDVNRERTIPAIYDQCEITGRLGAFTLDWQPGDTPEPHIFWDSDVAKWIEAASYALGANEDARLAERLAQVVALVVSAQQADGYLNVYYTAVEPEKRWTNLRDRHELYCAGHLIEAGVAYYEATGERILLNAVRRYADYIGTVFGREPGQKRGYPGHPEIELALVKLYRTTGESRYLELARYFVDERGQQPPHYFDVEALARGDDPRNYWARTHAYTQSHLPVREQQTVTGHAVRAMYLYSAMADLAGETGDPACLMHANDCGATLRQSGCTSPAVSGPRAGMRDLPPIMICRTKRRTPKHAPRSGWCFGIIDCCRFSSTAAMRT